MPDLRLLSPPPRADLLEQIRGRLGHAVPGARLIAEGMLGAETSIDFVAIEPAGRVALILVGGLDEDLELVGRGLAQRAWVAARLRDWTQLAPNLGIRPDAAVRVLLACPAYAPETRLAAASLGPQVMSLLLYRCIGNGPSVELVLEHVLADEPDPVAPIAEARPEAPPPFRTGLTDADLGLTPEEQREFE